MILKFLYRVVADMAQLIDAIGFPVISGRIYHWLTQRNYANAFYRLGHLYFVGYKHPRDKKKAIMLIDEAVFRGDKDAKKFKDALQQKSLYEFDATIEKFLDHIHELIEEETKSKKPLRILEALFFTLISILLIVATIYTIF